ncbi:outer membrane beta-barrel protein [bacterium]|nr:outer membrane beta-barrel protein [bacterium]MBU1985572.1 outer membrane beta-barrel protein [bacterium]
MKIRNAILVLALGGWMLGLMSTALAQSDIGFKGIGGRIGYVDPELDYQGTFTIGAVADLGTWIPQLHWDASLCYWSSSYDLGWLTDEFKVTTSDIALRSGVKYHFIEGPWEPYGGGGLGLHFFSVKADWPHDYWGSSSSSETEFGFYIVGGVEHQFNEQWKASGEVQLDWADLDQTNIQINVIYLLGK